MKALSVVDATVEFMIRAQEVYKRLVERLKKLRTVLRKRPLQRV